MSKNVGKVGDILLFRPEPGVQGYVQVLPTIHPTDTNYAQILDEDIRTSYGTFSVREKYYIREKCLFPLPPIDVGAIMTWEVEGLILGRVRVNREDGSSFWCEVLPPTFEPRDVLRKPGLTLKIRRDHLHPLYSQRYDREDPV